jgi:phage-related protein
MLLLEDGDVEGKVTPEEIDYELLSRALAYASLELKVEYVKVDDIYKLDLEALSGNLYFSATDPIGQIAEWIASKMQELANWFANTVSSLFDPVKRAVNDLAASVATLPSRIRDIVSSSADLIMSTIRNAASTIVTHVTQMASHIVSSVYEVVLSVSHYLSSLISGVSSAVASVGRNVADMISSAVSTISRAIDFVLSTLSSMITSVADRLAQGISKVASTVADWMGRIVDAVRLLSDSIVEAIRRVADTVAKGFDSILGALRDSVSKIATAIDLLRSALSKAVETIASEISSAVSNIVKTVSSSISQIGEVLGSKIADLLSSIQALGGVLDMILEALSRGFMSLTEALSTLLDSILTAAKTLADIISTGFDILLSALGDLVDTITSAINTLTSEVSRMLSNVVSEITSWLGKVMETISSSFSDVKNLIAVKVAEVLVPLEAQLKILDLIIDMLPTGFRELMQAAKLLFELIHTATNMIIDFIEAIIYAPFEPVHAKLDTIISEIGEKISPFIAPISETVRNILTKVGEIPSTISEKASEIISKLTDKIIVLADVLRELTGYVHRFGAMVLGGLASIEGFVRAVADFLAGIPGILTNIFGRIPGFIDWIISGVTSIGANVVSFIRDKIIAPLAEAIKVLREKISDILELGIDLGGMVFSKLAELVGALWNAFLSVLSKLIDLSFSTGRFFFSAFTDVGMAAMRYVMELFSKVIEALPKTLEVGLSPVVDRVFSTIGISSPPDITRVDLFRALVYSWGMLFYVALSALMTVGLVKFPAFIAKGYAIGMAQYDLTWEIDIHPWGLGLTIPFKPLKFLAGMISNFADELSKFADKIYEPFWFGMAFWLSRFFSVWYAYEMRNTIPIRLPTLRELEELWRRARVAEHLPPKMGRSVKDALEGYIYYTKLRGYADFLLEASFADPKRMYFTLIDRFGIERTVPLSRAWRIPTPSVVARMWVRDVLRPTGATAERMIENLSKIYEATGLYRDIGLLYTLLAFRYPSPRALSEFYWRSMASLNWLRDSMEEVEWSRMFDIPWRASDPYSLNVRRDRAEILNRMMSQYLKWHDLFPSAWDKDFPTDKAIVMELTADLPTRIDLRWLTRWGIFEHLSRSGVDVMADLITLFSQVPRLTGHETRETKATPEISLDVRFLSRFLIGRRINPVVAPLVAVAQIHAVLTPSFTLLRTGFIEALRRGWITLDTAEYLMSGLFVIRFRTGYIDPGTAQFREFEYRKPVFWLPAERRLLQIRGILDRYNWLLRDMLMRVVRALTLVALYPEEAREIFFSIQPPLAEHIRENIRALSGVDWRPEMDTRYIDIWMLYAQALSIIGARTWVRRHVSRTMGWVFFRILTGVIKHEHLERILSVLREIEVDGKKMRLLSDIEIAYYSRLGRELIELVRREAIPSPSTLGTFAEYMVIQSRVVDRVLEEHNVPQEFRDLWRQYISVKPVKSDFKSLISVAIRAFRVGVLKKQDLERILNEARQYGFTDIEISSLRRRIELEEAIEEAKGWKPTLSSLITISELVPEASEYFGMLKIDPRFRDLARRYAMVKPLADEARQLVNTYFRVRRYMEIPREIEEKVKEVAKMTGVTDTEWMLREMSLELQILLDESRVWTPNPSTLATLAEYLELDETLIKKAFERRRVVEPWRSIWLQYIKVRPVKSDYRTLINVARRARALEIISELRWSEIIKNAQEFGFTSREIEIIREIADLEMAIARARRWTPGVMTLIAISELVPEATEYIEKLEIDPRFKDLIMRYATIRPIADEARTLVNTYFRARRYVAIPEDIEVRVREVARLAGITDTEWMLREMSMELQALIDESRQWAPSPGTLATLSEFITLDENVVVRALERRRVVEPWRSIWLRYIRVRPVKSDYRALINIASRARVLGVIPEERWNEIIRAAEEYGFTRREVEIIRQVADLEMAIANAREWAPSVMTVVSISELVPEAVEILKEMPIRAKFRDLIVEYAKRRQISDEVRRLLSTFQRMRRLAALMGQRIPDEIVEAVERYSKMIGLTEDERRVRDLVSEMEVTMDQWLRGEVLPTLSTLASMAEFVEVPGDYVAEILTKRRVEKRFAELWMRFIQARVISTEVGRVVSAFTAFATRFPAPSSLEEQVRALMARGGWTPEEMEIFDLELAIRRHTRILSTLVPTLRQAVGDSLYMPDPGRIIEETLSAYGITVAEYARQIEYYKKLAKNRRIWRHFSWYRSQLVDAFVRGVIDERTLRFKLQKFKDMGLVDDDEIELIVDGAKLRALARARR